MTNDDTITAIIKREGTKFTDHPADRGGPTRWGLSQRFMSDLCNRPVSASEIEQLTEVEARSIYLHEFIIGPGFDRIADERLREQVIDAGVLHGTGWASRRLQEVAGVTADGIVGPVTEAAVNRSHGLRTAFLRRRVHRIGRIVVRDQTQVVWLVGWLRRALSFLD